MGFDHLFSYFFFNFSTWAVHVVSTKQENQKWTPTWERERERERKTTRQENRMNKQGQQHLNSWRRMKNNTHTHTSAAFEECKKLCKEEKEQQQQAKAGCCWGPLDKCRDDIPRFLLQREDATFRFVFFTDYLIYLFRGSIKANTI